MLRKLILNVYLVVYQVALMATISDLQENERKNKPISKKTISNIDMIVTELKRITIVPATNGKTPLTRKQKNLIELIMKYDQNTNLALSKVCAEFISKKYDLFLISFLIILFVVVTIIPLWDYLSSLSLLFFILNAFLLGLLVFSVGVLTRISLRQRIFVNVYIIELFALVIITFIF